MTAGHPPRWTLFIDGASRGNPGPAGAGAVLLGPQGEKKAEASRFLGETTNNAAEYEALLLGLDLALKHGARRLLILSDSELLVRQLLGAYKVRQPHLLSLWQQAREKLGRLEGYLIRHVRREANATADRLARQAIDRERGKR